MNESTLRQVKSSQSTEQPAGQLMAFYYNKSYESFSCVDSYFRARQLVLQARREDTKTKSIES